MYVLHIYKFYLAQYYYIRLNLKKILRIFILLILGYNNTTTRNKPKTSCYIAQKCTRFCSSVASSSLFIFSSTNSSQFSELSSLGHKNSLYSSARSKIKG